MAPEIERNNWSIVLIGSFNPAIFHPSWYLHNRVSSKEVAEAATISVVHPEIASISLGTMRIEVQQNRYTVQTELPPDVAILDHIVLVFGDLLPHSEIEQFGINRAAHFRTRDRDARISLGRLFAPTEPWGEFGERIARSQGDQIGGMMGVTMRENLNESAWAGHIDARLSPAYELDRETGVQVLVNNHFSIKEYEKGEGTSRALSVLRSEFEPRMAASEKIISAILDHLT